jgi:hypothetical protein
VTDAVIRGGVRVAGLGSSSGEREVGGPESQDWGGYGET